MFTKTFTYKNANIYYKTNSISNKDKTIICLHGFLESNNIFDFVFNDTAFKDFKIIAVDLLGHGKSECIGYIHTMEDQADMIYDLMTSLNISKTCIIGHSMGGYVALAFLEHYKENVEQLILLNSTSLDDSNEKKINRQRGVEIVKKNASVFIQMAISNLFNEVTKNEKFVEIEKLKIDALKQPTQGVIANMMGMLERKNRNYLIHQFKNIYYIVGNEDLLINESDIKKETFNTDAKVFTLNGGHMLWLENPEDTKKILKSILI